MADLPVLWRPNPGPQTAFLASSAYEALYGGAAGGGKSDSLLFGALRQIHHPSYRALILRRTFPELRELMDRALEHFGAVGGVWNASEKRWRFPSGATVEFGYCQTYADVQQYQGQSFQFIGFDELGQVAEERIWTYLMSRNRPGDAGLTMHMRATANPGGAGHHWIKARFIDVCLPNGTMTAVPMIGTPRTTSRAYFRALLADNPVLMANDPGYADRLRHLPELEYRWLAEGDWSAGGGLAFPELAQKDRYFIQPLAIPSYWTLWGGFDWGYQHPFSFGLYAADDSGNVYCVDSTSGRHMQPPEIAERWRNLLVAHRCETRKVPVHAGHDCWADIKARGENVPTLTEQFYREGFLLHKASISRIAGVQNLRRYFSLNNGIPRVRFFDTPGNRAMFECIATRIADPDELEDVLKQDADESGNGGDDRYDQCVHGDTLVKTDRGDMAIHDMVGTTGTCLTPRGWLRYHSVRQTRALASMLRVTDDAGKCVVATGDHRVLTRAGWQRLDRLTVGDTWITVAATDRGQQRDTGVSGAEVLADEVRVLSPSYALVASGSVHSELRNDPAEAPYSPPGRVQGEQSARELGSDFADGAYESTLDASTSGAGRDSRREYPTDDEGMASVAGGVGVALGQRQGDDGEAERTSLREVVRDVRQDVHDDCNLRTFLPPELQDASANPAARCGEARITRIELGPVGPVYNLEVDEAYCFAVNGGVVVHNCRYALAARPLVAKIPPQPDQAWAVGRDPKMRERKTGGYVGTEIEEQEQSYDAGIGASFPLGAGF